MQTPATLGRTVPDRAERDAREDANSQSSSQNTPVPVVIPSNEEEKPITVVQKKDKHKAIITEADPVQVSDFTDNARPAVSPQDMRAGSPCSSRLRGPVARSFVACPSSWIRSIRLGCWSVKAVSQWSSGSFFRGTNLQRRREAYHGRRVQQSSTQDQK